MTPMYSPRERLILVAVVATWFLTVGLPLEIVDAVRQSAKARRARGR